MSDQKQAKYLVYMKLINIDIIKIGHSEKNYILHNWSNGETNNGGDTSKVLYLEDAQSKEEAKNKESYFHEMFKKHRIDGEKFKYNLLNEIGIFISKQVMTDSNFQIAAKYNIEQLSKMQDPLQPLNSGYADMFDFKSQIWKIEIVSNFIPNDKFRVRNEIITPEIAEKLLKRNRNNRPHKWRRVKAIARDMKNGTLVDGQHRLMGCILSGNSFASLVVFNLAKDVFPNIDKGAGRSDYDSAYVNGTDIERKAIAYIRLGFTLDGVQPSEFEKQEAFKDQDNLKFTKIILNTIKNSDYNKQPIGTALLRYMIYYKNDSQKLDYVFDFMKVLDQGYNCPESQLKNYKGVIKLREYITNFSKKAQGGRRDNSTGSGINHIYLVVSNILNKMASGKKIIRISTAGCKNDPFALVAV